jgi:hypothetical protein
MDGNVGAPFTSITARRCYVLKNIIKLLFCSASALEMDYFVTRLSLHGRKKSWFLDVPQKGLL